MSETIYESYGVRIDRDENDALVVTAIPEAYRYQVIYLFLVPLAFATIFLWLGCAIVTVRTVNQIMTGNAENLTFIMVSLLFLFCMSAAFSYGCFVLLRDLMKGTYTRRIVIDSVTIQFTGAPKFACEFSRSEFSGICIKHGVQARAANWSMGFVCFFRGKRQRYFLIHALSRFDDSTKVVMERLQPIVESLAVELDLPLTIETCDGLDTSWQEWR